MNNVFVKTISKVIMELAIISVISSFSPQILFFKQSKAHIGNEVYVLLGSLGFCYFVSLFMGLYSRTPINLRPYRCVCTQGRVCIYRGEAERMGSYSNKGCVMGAPVYLVQKTLPEREQRSRCHRRQPRRKICRQD